MKLLSFTCAFLLSLGLFAQDGLDDGLYAKITSDKGVIILALEFEKAPMTVANFVGLAEGKLAYDTVEVEEPYYDGMKFHRVMNNFMIQGGCPLGNGTGDPGYKFPDEFDSTLIHSGPGILSMANSGVNTNGSQFFITHKATPWLDRKHAVFGHVVSGQDVVDATEKDDIMKTVEIIRVGKKAKKFKAHKIFPVLVAERLAAIKRELEIRNKTFYTEMIKIYPNALRTESGLMYEIIQEGKGVKPISGAEVELHYTGTFVDGNKFDSSVDRGKKFKFMVDAGRVIKGWDEGVKLCDIGGKIKLILPYWLAYGESGRSAIPPKASLIFDIEVFGSTQDQ